MAVRVSGTCEPSGAGGRHLPDQDAIVRDIGAIRAQCVGRPARAEEEKCIVIGAGAAPYDSGVKALHRHPQSPGSRPPCSCCMPACCPIIPTMVTPCGTSSTAPGRSPVSDRAGLCRQSIVRQFDVELPRMQRPWLGLVAFEQQRSMPCCYERKYDQLDWESTSPSVRLRHA